MPLIKKLYIDLNQQYIVLNDNGPYSSFKMEKHFTSYKLKIKQ